MTQYRPVVAAVAPVEQREDWGLTDVFTRNKRFPLGEL